MSYKLIINSTDVSDYITSIGEVPIISRNPDYTIIYEGYKCKLSSASTVIPVKNDSVYFYSGSILLHNGYIDSIQYNYDDRDFEIEVSHIFKKFEDVLVSPTTTFNNYLYNNTIQKNVYGQTTTLIKHKSLIKAIFDIEGLTVDTSSYCTNNTFNWYAWHDHVMHTAVAGNDDEIYYLPEQILNINQDGIYTPGQMNPPDDTVLGNQITVLELLSLLSSITGYAYAPKDTSSFYIINNNDHQVIDTNKIYNYQETNYIGDIGLYINYKTLPTDNKAGLGYVGYLNTYWLPTNKTQTMYISETTAQMEYTTLDIHLMKNKEITWYNNFNPILVSSAGTGSVCTPDIGVSSCVNYKWKALIDATKIEMVVDANEVSLSNQLYAVERMSVDDIKHNTIKIEYRIY